jgi:hypothetical protein
MSSKFVTIDRNWWPGWVAVVVAGMEGVGAGQNLMGRPEFKFQPANRRKGYRSDVGLVGKTGNS